MPLSRHYLALLLATTTPLPAVAQRDVAVAHPIRFDVERFTLPNGLTVLVHSNRRNPNVFVGVYYRVGAKDEPRARSGFAHLFEHLMFQPTAHREGDYLVPMTIAGARDVNASTLADYTEYHQTVPTNALDLALWLESDRMAHLTGGLTQQVLDEQRAVIKNEASQTPTQVSRPSRMRSYSRPPMKRADGTACPRAFTFTSTSRCASSVRPSAPTAIATTHVPVETTANAPSRPRT